MSIPRTLSQPLAERVAGLPAPAAPPENVPEIPSNVIEAAVDALARGETHYTDRPGIPEFRREVAKQINEAYGLALDPAEVTITCGSTEARFVTVTLFAEAGTRILCPGDVSHIGAAAQLVGATVTDDSDADNISLLYLTPADDTDTINQLLDRAEQNNWWVVWDLSFTTGRPDFHPAQREELRSRTVTINSLSAHMAGFRIGWMAGSEAALRLRASKQALTICTTNVSQWAGLEFVRTNEI